MGRLAIGALVAGAVMFVLGFIFYGTPLMTVAGLPPADQPSGATMVNGYIHLAVSAFVLAWLLWTLRDKVDDLASRTQLVIWASLTTVVFTYLGHPVWEGTAWNDAIYNSVAGFVMLFAAGYVLARWFVSGDTAAKPAGAA